MMEVLLFLLGLVLLVVGAQALVRGASLLALSVGISPLVVGLTVVAFGTSSPELAVSVQSSFAGRADLALGNVVGSNIFNVLLILGVSALIVPLLVARQLVRQEVPVMIGVSLLLLVLALDGRVGRADGALLLGLLIAYTAFLVYQSRRQNQGGDAGLPDGVPAAAPGWTSGPLAQLLLIAAGLGALVLGATWLVDAAVSFAQYLGISELVIGLTIVAAGTSLPEVATSVVAALRGKRDIAVGNVVGSNVFNILGVLGLSSLVSPAGISVAPAVLAFDLPVMIAVALACMPIFFTGNLIARWEGALFLGLYLAYTAYVVLAAQQHDALQPYSAIMATAVLPLVAVTVAVVAWREWRNLRRA
ncbi:calcium/sodium antiporter [Massilia sp. GCM10020059]|uniref:Calcium/sodium antiporter n=1 Tax=Massilia agrisoli TaxID=2892444 RepID=A0ABS8IW83_9BURK|nr:calcium/sodium antiporter [Massilia agrisoli]MCC6071938.1 calcium/sodium antiporter [Massilia agrisoli]